MLLDFLFHQIQATFSKTRAQKLKGGSRVTIFVIKIFWKPLLIYLVWCEKLQACSIWTTPGTKHNQVCPLPHCSRPFYLILALIIWLCCCIRPGHTPLCLHVRVCVWCQHCGEHTLRTDADGLSRNSSSRLGLLRGGEGKSGKINKTSLWFVLFLFQNKQSCGRANCRGFSGGCWVLYSYFDQNNLDRDRATRLSPQQPERRHASESEQVIYRNRCSVSHPLVPLPFNWFSRQIQMRVRDHNYCRYLHLCGYGKGIFKTLRHWRRI